MGVRIIQGLAGSGPQDAKVANVQPNANATGSSVNIHLTSSVPQALIHSTAANDAVVTSLRSQRSTQSSEKIKDYKEAREVSGRVAEQVRADPGSPSAHGGLETTQAQSHFAE